MNAAAPADLENRWDMRRRFIRIVQEHGNGMVEFEFAVGEPGLFVEMLMPRPQFLEFCAMQGVAPTHGRLQPPSEDGAAGRAWDWSPRDARERRLGGES